METDTEGGRGGRVGETEESERQSGSERERNHRGIEKERE